MFRKSILNALVFSFFSFLSCTSYSQDKIDMNFSNEPYAKEWKEILELDSKRLPKSALEKVEALYEKAVGDNNPAQVVKTTIYRMKYFRELEEDGGVKMISKIEEEARNAKFPVQSILQSMLGELYQNYVQNNYWKFNNRTNTPEYKSEDIETWSIAQLIEASTLYYGLSVKESHLSEIEIKQFASIFAGDFDTQKLRPTLFDFLMHRAIDHFMNEQTYLSKPNYTFYIKDKVAFAEAGVYVKNNFESRDTASQKLKTLKLFQALLSKHLNDRDPVALIDADLKRLKFVYNNSTSDLKESWYLEALQQMEKKHLGNKAVAEILYAQAEIYYQKGQSYNPKTNIETQWDLKKAHELYQKAVTTFPKSFGARHSALRISQIENIAFNISAEEVILPKKLSLFSIQYKNISEVYVKIVALEEADLRKWRNLDAKEIIAFLNTKKIVSRQKETLPNDADFQYHRTEIKTDALSTGMYALLVSDEPNFKKDNELLTYVNFTVSTIGYFSRKDEKGNLLFVTANRETGEVMKGVKIEYFKNEYNRRKRKNELVKLGEDVSNKNGFVRPKFRKDQYFVLRLSKGKDVLVPNNGYSIYNRRNRTEKTHKITRFFLDRAIYRPGQTVYFKALLVEKDKNNIPHVLANKKVTITLQDVNWQEVKKVELTTNEYGTVQGSFVAPQFGLRGNMHLLSSIGDSRHSFRVEEYKRPKFEVEMKAYEGAYSLGDKITTKGVATAFAGNAIDGAMVKYRVVREARFPWWPWWYGRPAWPSSGQMEIANGEVQTAADGSFEIEFEALADLSIPKDKKPSFRFTVYADVVDITGETHSTQRSFNLAYISLKALIDVPEEVQREREIKFSISTTNLDGAFQAAKGKIEIYRLETPEQAFVNRYWEVPDKPMINKHKFKRQFPHFAYADEDKIQNWVQAEKKLVSTFDTEKEKQLVLNMNDWAGGAYVVILQTKDEKSGETIEDKRFFKLYDANKKMAPTGVLFWDKTDKLKYKPGETVSLNVAGGYGNIHYLIDIERRIDKKSNPFWANAGKWDSQKINLTEADKGGLVYQMAYMKYNRAFTQSGRVAVPWEDKELKITYSTFRDKLKPGENEEWQIKISGPQGDKVAAEVVAGMYDASLDAFAKNYWQTGFFPSFTYSYRSWNFTTFSQKSASTHRYRNYSTPQRVYPTLNWFGLHNTYYDYGAQPRMYSANSAVRIRGSRSEGMEKKAMAMPVEANMEVAEMAMDGIPPPPSPPIIEEVPNELLLDEEKPAPIKIRTNLNETVFFMPQLHTDKEGNIVIKFTMNEALTKWKFMTFAHTTDLKTVVDIREIVTQKELMVQPNPPRFFREGDVIEFTAKVSNLTENELSGVAKLELFDATTMQPIDEQLGHTNTELLFTAAAGQSAPLSWKLTVPKGGAMAITHRVTARAGSFSDGEESALPVLTNRMLVTETMPMNVRGGETKTFTFSQMDKAAKSRSLQNHKLSLEFTSNPAWYAVKALPYLMEYPYDCTEQIFSRYYANTLASSVANKYPKIRSVFDQWKDTPALESELSKNQELKAILLAETPWVLQAQSEAQQRKNIALLFDLNKMAHEKEAALAKLRERQSSNGGFSWFPGGRDSRYITQYLVEGMGHLQHIGVEDFSNDQGVKNMLNKAIVFIDEELKEEYANLEREVQKGRTTFDKDHLSNMAIHYLYTRSFFDNKTDKSLDKITEYYLGQAEKYWTERGLYQQGLIALALNRSEAKKTTQAMIKSFRERALQHEELGMYWKYNSGWFWYQLPIETHSLMIEVFAEVAQDNKAVDELKIWLLKNKETTHWKTTKATANAVYALLANGSNWLIQEKELSISLPKAKEKEVTIRKARNTAEAGSGYFKATWNAAEINTRMKKIKVSNPNEVVAWGSMYWQYFEDLDKIEFFEDTPLKLKKQLFREENTDKGLVLRAIDDKTGLHPGDKIKVRIELRVDRAMEYVHMKDMRASGFEPINVLSSYKWQGGLGYYESTGDAATNFFFSYLPKGTYVFEYPLRVIHKGDFSNGVTTVQCMYAPKFTSHSEGVRVLVK